MASENISYINISIKYGVLVGIAHIVYFILMGVFGLQHIIELSFISAVFLIVGIVKAIANFKRLKGGEISYFQGLGIGVITGLVSSIVLAVFLVIYISLIDASYLQNLQASALFPDGLSLLALFALTIVYGTWPGFFIAFIAMQWYKRRDHTMPERI
ncbi:tetrahydromethanopterin S-methyltransferase subunit E [Pontibacter aydingkolensis]|uniref:DUF4199 domain-containing protein n=1 Tax=Pontibacter aydingkolensis TaxID=1911536 RepID=A0ABS7CU36_9BACT|nr:DUF4199 domain-containing protein [Pontibacter aydingkolensis]MBW7467369.1 DUF4199 domain-containing protein [Pontibacter aydingkolensis]